MNKFKDLHSKKNSAGGGYPGTAPTSANNPYSQQSPATGQSHQSGSLLSYKVYFEVKIICYLV